MSHNGWKNYETWCVDLWLDNDYDGLLESLVDEAGSVYNGADAIKDYVEQMRDEFTRTSGLFADLLSAALSEVDWREIAENHKPDEWGDADEAPEDDDEEEEKQGVQGK